MDLWKQNTPTSSTVLQYYSTPMCLLISLSGRFFAQCPHCSQIMHGCVQLQQSRSVLALRYRTSLLRISSFESRYQDILAQWYFCKGYQSGALLWFCTANCATRSVLAIYKLLWAGLYPYSFFNLGKNHQLTTDVYDSQFAKSPTQFSALLSICLNM